MICYIWFLNFLVLLVVFLFSVLIMLYILPACDFFFVLELFSCCLQLHLFGLYTIFVILKIKLFQGFGSLVMAGFGGLVFTLRSPPILMLSHFLNKLTHLSPIHPFSTPLETSENRKVFWCFQGVEKGCTGSKWVND